MPHAPRRSAALSSRVNKIGHLRIRANMLFSFATCRLEPLRKPPSKCRRAPLSAVDSDVCAIDPRGALGQDERDHVRDLLSCAEASPWKFALFELGEAFGFARPESIPAAALEHDRTGAD